MIVSLRLFCLIWLASVTAAFCQAAEPEEYIRGIVRDQEVAWNQGDAEGYSRHFAVDGTFTNIRGTHFVGRDAFIARHVEIFAGFFRGSRMRSNIERIHFPSPNVALVDVRHEVSGLTAFPPGVPASSDGVLRTMLLQVFVRNPAGWELVAYHNVDVKPKG